jgi:hypothetical protein
MASAWLDLAGDQAAWRPARMLMAAPSGAEYACEVLIGSGSPGRMRLSLQ